MPQTQHATFDTLLEMKDAGLVAADAAAQVGGSDKILDLGSDEQVWGKLIIDISAIEVASGDERYDIIVQGSTTSDFSSGIEDLACMITGDAAAIPGDTDTAVGRHILPFTNDRAGTVYRFLRVFTDVTGTIATGINYKAFIAKM